MELDHFAGWTTKTLVKGQLSQIPFIPVGYGTLVRRIVEGRFLSENSVQSIKLRQSEECGTSDCDLKTDKNQLIDQAIPPTNEKQTSSITDNYKSEMDISQQLFKELQKTMKGRFIDSDLESSNSSHKLNLPESTEDITLETVSYVDQEDLNEETVSYVDQEDLTVETVSYLDQQEKEEDFESEQINIIRDFSNIQQPVTVRLEQIGHKNNSESVKTVKRQAKIKKFTLRRLINFLTPWKKSRT